MVKLNVNFVEKFTTYTTFCFVPVKGIPSIKKVLEIQRLLKDNLFKPFSVFLAVLRRQSTKTSRGRQKNNYNREFEKLLKQVESGASNFLDTYDVKLCCL